MANFPEKSVSTSAAERQRSAKKSKQLLVVDKARFSGLIQQMVKDRVEVTCVDNCVQAVRSMRFRRPDVVLAELSVEGGGLRLAELMDMNVRFHHTPFILTCINPTSDTIQRAKKLKVDSVLVKPFPPSALIEMLGGLLDRNTETEPILLTEEENEGIAAQIKDRMASIDGLPPFPATHAEVMRLSDSDDANSDDVADQIQMDPNFLATVLKLANSSAYGFARRVDSLKMAVSLLGFQEIANLVMSLQVFKELGEYDSQSRFDSAAFWKHSVGTAFFARTIATKLNAEIEMCFMAGLLHDIGKVVLDRFFGEFFSESSRVVRDRQVSCLEAELETLGVTHPHVGGYLALNWNFSDTLIEAIVCHHDPSLAKHFVKVASVVHVANAICNHLEYGSSGEAVVQEPNDPVLGKALWKLGIGPNSFGKMVDLGKEQIDAADDFLAVLSGGA